VVKIFESHLGPLIQIPTILTEVFSGSSTEMWELTNYPIPQNVLGTSKFHYQPAIEPYSVTLNQQTFSHLTLLTSVLILSSHLRLRCRFQWPRGLRSRYASERLLGSWARTPPEAWMFVSCECLCCQVEVSATGRSLVQTSPTDCGVCLSVIK
jgi:hypothetical protein